MKRIIRHKLRLGIIQTAVQYVNRIIKQQKVLLTPLLDNGYFEFRYLTFCMSGKENDYGIYSSETDADNE